MAFSTNGAERMRIDSAGRVGIGTSSPAADFHIDQGPDNRVLITSNGPTLIFKEANTTDDNFGFYHNASKFHLQTLDDNFGSVANIVTATQLGQIGIGTTSPTQKLEVSPDSDIQAIIGRARIGDLGYDDFAGFGHYDTGAAYAILQYNTGETYVNAGAGTDLNFRINNTNVGMFKSDGNFGIGTTSPNQDGFSATSRVLTVKAPSSGGTGALELIGLANSSGDLMSAINFMSYAVGNPAARITAVRHTADDEASIAFDTSGAERMRITQAGNVGIGTTSPTAPLHVNGDVKADTLQLQDDSKMGFGTANAAASVGHTAAGPEGIFWHTDRNSYGVYRTTGAWSAPNYSQLKLDFTTGIILDGGSAYGKSGVRVINDLICGSGTGYPHSASINSAYFHATGDTSQPACRLVQVSNSNSYPVIRMRHESTTAGRYIEFRTDENVLTGVIQDVSGTMAYQSSSDSRLKENVEPMTEGLTEVLAMNPVKFNWKDIVTENKTVDMESAESRGFLAQELNEEYPWAVSEGGEDEKEKPWSVDYGKLTPILVKAIQEQQTIIDDLKSRIETLENA